MPYWCADEELSTSNIHLPAARHEGLLTFTPINLELPTCTSLLPVEVRTRDALLCYVDSTELDQGRLPPPEWTGWSGQLI